MLTDAIREFFNSDAGKLAAGMLLVAVLDLILGVLAAFRDDTFELDSVAAWLRKHIAGRVLPIWVLLFAGQFAEGLEISDINLIVLAGTGAALLYIAETVGSIVASWGPKHEVQSVPID